ncbi:MAG TPA: PfkB family carbohydrate kinase, partial [Chloroflexaceae bacterium]|nr:PfkB family carbohydrate kinase [Chloroflexaceae bacterium]
MGLIVAFGNPVYDEIVTPSVQTAGRVLSGCSTNGCLALARLGHQTALVGRVGADRHEGLLDELRRHGILARVEPGAETGGFQLVYDTRGERTLDVLGVADPIAHIPDECADARALIIGPILQETPLDFIERICERSEAPVFLDPQGLL